MFEKEKNKYIYRYMLLFFVFFLLLRTLLPHKTSWVKSDTTNQMSLEDDKKNTISLRYRLLAAPLIGLIRRMHLLQCDRLWLRGAGWKRGMTRRLRRRRMMMMTAMR